MEKTKTDIGMTPYDDVFKSVAKKCPQLLLPLIHEMFYKNKLIVGLYGGTEEIELLNTGVQRLHWSTLDMNLSIMVASFFCLTMKKNLKRNKLIRNLRRKILIRSLRKITL